MSRVKADQCRSLKFDDATLTSSGHVYFLEEKHQSFD